MEPCFVVRHGADGKISGYLVVQTQKIGPRASEDEPTAAGLLQAAWALSYGDDSPRALVPGENEFVCGCSCRPVLRKEDLTSTCGEAAINCPGSASGFTGRPVTRWGN